MGTRLSTALMPVCMGSLTEMRGMMPGAFRPTRLRSLEPRGPFGGETKRLIGQFQTNKSDSYWIKKFKKTQVSSRWSDLAIDGVSQSVHNTAEQLQSDRNVHDSPRSLDNITLFDQFVVTEHHNTNVIRLQVQRHALCWETKES